MSGFRAYQMTVAACRLMLPDLVAGGAKGAAELAAETGTHPESLHRILRALTVWGFFVETPDGRFGPTPLSDTFRSDKPGLRNMTIMLSEEGYQAWGDLMYTLRTGKPAYEHMYGKSHFDRLGEDPEMAAHFNAAMVEFSTRVAATFAAAFDFTGVRTAVDVAGGNGALLIGVLQAHPEMKGVLFDLAQGLAGADEKLVAAGVSERVTLQEGSFFEAVPSGADLYMLKSIVHDWDDERALAILQTCVRAMHSKSRLVLLERKLPERVENRDDAFTTVMGDVHMMVVLGGKERTANEFRELLAQAGLHMTREVPMESDITAFEAVLVA
ncbi:MAG TPA: methyltransferase [Candidatus Acidoferrum sp.]|nr:methyltransferase [Candidatus Acidoferrum sp.]